MSPVGPTAAQVGPATPSTTAATAPLDAESDHGEHIGELSTQRAEDLGLAVDLTPQLWTDAEAVAAHFVLADTTYEALEDPLAVNTRRASYATPPLAAEINRSSGGAARLDELRRRNVGFSGEVSAVTTIEANDRLAMVNIAARVTMTAADQPPSAEVHFYDLTLVYDDAFDRWLVAAASRS